MLMHADDEVDTASEMFAANFVHIYPIKEGAAKEFITSFTVDVGNSLSASLLYCYLSSTTFEFK